MRTETWIAAYDLKLQRFQINNLTFHPKDVEKLEQTKPKASRRKDIIQIRIEMK